MCVGSRTNTFMSIINWLGNDRLTLHMQRLRQGRGWALTWIIAWLTVCLVVAKDRSKMESIEWPAVVQARTNGLNVKVQIKECGVLLW